MPMPSGPRLDPVRAGVAGGVTALQRDERAVRATSSTILGMVLFVASEAMFFAAFFGAYFSAYANHAVWPPNNLTMPDLGLPSIAIAALVVSTGVLQLALRAANRRKTAAVRQFLVGTLVAGLLFLGLTVAGYTSLTFGISDGLFPSLFYLVTVIGAAHVVGGVVLLVIVLQKVGTGEAALTAYESLRALAIYWNFVVLLAAVIYVVFYVLTTTPA